MTTKISPKIRYFTMFFSIIFICVLIASLGIVLARNYAIEISEASYETLSSQRDIIKEDFNKVYSYDNYTIAPAEEGYEVTLTAPTHGITMSCNFDSNFNYVDSTYIEPTIIESYMICIAVIVGFGTIASFVVIWAGKKMFY